MRIQKKLKTIEDLYKLAYETTLPDVNMKTYEGEFVLNTNEKDLINATKQLAKSIKELKRSAKNKVLAERLTQVHAQFESLVREEYRPLRSRNNRISIIED